MPEWVTEEFGTVDFGDRRLTTRLQTLAAALGAQPGASLPEACGDASASAAAYRFFKNTAVTPEAIVAGHVQATWQRVRVVPLVLAVQDTTLLDWSHHPATTGLGSLARAPQRGLLAHTTLAFTPEGVPRGLLAQEVWARTTATYGQLPDQHDRPLAEQESQQWLTSLAAVIAAQQQCPGTRFVRVGDREPMSTTSSWWHGRWAWICWCARPRIGRPRTGPGGCGRRSARLRRARQRRYGCRRAVTSRRARRC